MLGYTFAVLKKKMNSKPARPETLALGKKRPRKAAPLKEIAKKKVKTEENDPMVTIEVPQSKELEAMMESIFSIPPPEGPTSTADMVMKGMDKIQALEERLEREAAIEMAAAEAALKENKVALAEEKTKDSAVTVTDLSCPIHPWEPLCPGSSGDFWYEKCGYEGCLVFIPTQHLDVMLKQLKYHVHPMLKEQWATLRCDCGLRPRMKLSLSEKNYQKVYLTCGVNRRGVEEFGKERCRYFQWIHWKPRKITSQASLSPLVEAIRDGDPKSKLFHGPFIVGGTFNTIVFPEEFRNLDSRPYLKTAYDGMQSFPEWKTELYLAALTRYLKEEGKREEVVEIVQGLKDKHSPNTYSVLFEEALENAKKEKKLGLKLTCDC